MGSLIPTTLRAIGEVSSLVAQNYDKIDLAYNTIQAGCIRKGSESPHFFSKLDNHQHLFYIADIISLIATSILALLNLERKYNISLLDSVDIISFSGWLTFSSILGLGLGSVALLNKFYKPTDLKLKEMTFERPIKEKTKQLLNACRIIINIALVFFCPTNPFFILSAALEVYSLIKISQRVWCKFTKRVDRELAFTYLENFGRHFWSRNLQPLTKVFAHSMSVTYLFLMQPFVHSKTDPENTMCTICRENDPSPDVYFCKNHTFHLSCVAEMLNTKLQDFGRFLRVKDRIVTETIHYHPFSKETSYSAMYHIDMPRNALPSCPNCRNSPNQNDLIVEIQDEEYGNSPSEITLID
jgi:hypothetical protein